jgi:hypothetical protein
VQSLDLPPGGRVSKEEFIACWNKHARLIFPPSKAKASAVVGIERGAVFCTVL